MLLNFMVEDIYIELINIKLLEKRIKLKYYAIIIYVEEERKKLYDH